MLFEFHVALRYLITKRKEKFVSFVGIFAVIGIALGIAALIVVMSVMNGFQRELMTKILGVNGHISLESNMPIKNFNDCVKFIDTIPEVQAAIPMVTAQAMILNNENMIGIVLNGISYQYLEQHPFLNHSMRLEEIPALAYSSGESGAIIGLQLAQVLNVGVGDAIRILAPSNFTSMLGMLPRIKDLRIAGIFATGMYEYDSSFIYVDLSSAQKIFNVPSNSASNIDIFLRDDRDTKKIKKQITAKYKNLRVYDWQEKNSGFFNALKVEKTVMFVILTMIVLVAAFNIVSSLVMLVQDKADSIAVMRTIGVSGNSIIMIFVLIGFIIGATGVIIGAIIGCGIASNIDVIRIFLEQKLKINLFNPVVYFLNNLPSHVLAKDIIYAASIAMFFALIATIFPALKASRMSPGRLLRFY